MANVVVLGGGFAGVIAAESLARRLGQSHWIMLISRDREFIFFLLLVRLASGRCKLVAATYTQAYRTGQRKPCGIGKR
jgi:NADH dehydrogenase FAD-containing subunit